MSKRKMVIGSMIISIFLLCGIFAYAYFAKTIDNTHNISTTLPTQTVEVNNAVEFYNAVQYYDDSTNDKYNSNELVSNSTKRKTITLTASIKFYTDVLVTADCHINLNGYELDLNGHNLTFKHQFEGRFAIYSNPSNRTDTEGVVTSVGSIIDTAETKGTIIIDCPNASIDFDYVVETENDNNVNLVPSSQIVIKEASPSQVINSAMKLVYSNLQNAAINDFYTTIDTVEDFGKGICGNSFTHTTDSHSCIYTFTDLDLIYNYFAYEGLTVSYSSGNTDVLTSGGKVLATSTTTTVPLIVTITYKETTITKVVDVHVLANADYGKASNNILLMYLDKYYDSNEKKYKVDRAILLPKKNTYFGTTYSYSITSSIGTITFDPTKDTFNDFFDGTLSNDYIVTTLTTDVTGLTITTGNTSNSVSVSGTASSAINDNYSYAAKIAMDLYGNQLVIYDDKTSNTYTMYELLTNPNLEGYGYSRLEKISYAVDCSEGTYIVSDITNNNDFDLLKVKDDATTKPYLGQTATLIVDFYFTTDGPDEDSKKDVVSIPIPIVYKVNNSGEGFDDFAPYYVYFDKQFSNVTNNYSYSSFNVPLSLDGSFPSYGFIVYEKVVDENGQVTYTYVTNSEEVIAGRSFMKVTSNTDNYTSFDGTTQMSITIDPYYIKNVDTDYCFLYVPLWKDIENVIYYYYNKQNVAKAGELSTINLQSVIDDYKYKSMLTVPGIVRYQSANSVNIEEFADKEMYKIAYELINPDDKYADGKFILSSTLGNKIDKVDLSNATTSLLAEYSYTLVLSTPDTNGNVTDTANQINSLKGINLLTGINELTFAGTNLGANTNFVTNLGYVAQITNLTKLDLSNTGIYDQTAGTLGFPSGNDNGVLSTLSALQNLEVLNLANNKFYDFTALGDFDSLLEVNVTGNVIEVNGSTIQVLNEIFERIVNLIYGSNGALNAAVFATLTSKHVNVIGGGNATNDPNIKAVVKALNTLEYQDKVPTGMDLNTILAQFENKELYVFGAPDSFELDCGSSNIITFTFDSIDFVPATDGESFSMIIRYDWVVRWNNILEVENSDDNGGPIAFRHEYKVTRY